MERAIPWSILVVLMTTACFWRPRPMRGVIGVFFGIMGLGVHGSFIATNPASYVSFARQALVPCYAELAEAVVTGITPVAFGVLMLVIEMTLALLILSWGRNVKAGLFLGIVFLLAITPLGIEVLPNAILALGLWRLAREQYPQNVLAELRGWRAAKLKDRATRSLTGEAPR